MKLGVLTTRLFAQPASGGELCTARLLAELHRQGHDLHVIGRGDAPPPAERWRCSSLGRFVPAHAEMSAAARAGSLAAAWLRRRAWTVHRTCAGGAAARALALLAAETPADVLVVDHLHTFAWLRGRHDLPPLVLVMHNIESAGYPSADGEAQGLRARVLAREARLLRALEDEVLRRAAAIACLGEDDAELLSARAHALGLNPLIAVLPGYALRPPAAVAPRAAGPRRIGLIGTWTWAPNRRALRWMLDQVRPRLPAGCQLVLAGTGLDSVEADAPGMVIKLGPVPDVAAFYAAVDVLAIAALDGSGVQEKAIEALGSGLPVVATPHALRGLHPLPAGVRVATTAAEFAQACAEALPPAPEDTARWSDERRRRYGEALVRCVRAASAAGIEAW